MSINPPPDQNLPIFNPIDYLSSSTDGITREYADENYLKFPIGQGTETIPVLNVSGATALGVTTFTDVNPAYEIKYPVNSGRIDFYSNTSGGVSTRGCKIDATGVHTISKYDTIDETAGALNIGTLVARTGTIQIGGATGSGAGRTINIGTTGGSGTNTVNIGGSTITVGSSNTSFLTCNPNSTSALQLGNNMTGGSIVMGGATGGSTTIAIGNGSAQTGAISIGTGNTSSSLPITIGNQTGSFGSVDIGTTTITVGRSNTATNNIQTSSGGTLNLKTTATGGAINIGNTTGGTITLNRPITPAYSGTTPVSTEIGYKADIAGLVFSATSLPTGLGNITTTAFSIPTGVWLVNVVLQATLTAGAGNYLRLSLSTTSATIQSARTIDFNPNTNSNNYFNYTTTVANASATNYFLVQDTGTATASSVSLIINITRIA